MKGLERMRLIPVTQNDLIEAHTLMCVPEVYRFLADGVEPPRAIAEHWINHAERDWDLAGGGLWALKKCGPRSRILGLVRLSKSAAGELELTYLLHPDYWGRGLATRMAHTAIGICFSRSITTTIWAGADEPNLASISVMRRLGMRFRQRVAYPSGWGVEYDIGKGHFAPERFDTIEVATR